MKKKLLILLMAGLLAVGCTSPKDDKAGEDKKAAENSEKTDANENKDANENADAKEDANAEAGFKAHAISELEKIAETYKKSTLAKDAIAELEKIQEDADTMTFTDDTGRESVTVKKRPKKVAVFYSSYASMYDELGGKIDLIIGGDNAVEVYKFQRGKDITEGKNVIVTSPSGKNWDVEKIIAEKPDLIICAMTSNGYGTIEEAAKAAGIDLIGISFNGVRDYAKWAYIYTSLNDNQEAFDNVALKTIEGVSKIIEEVPIRDHKPQVISIMPVAKGIKGNYTQSDLGTILQDLGTQNRLGGEVKKGASPRVDISIEDIVKMNPEYIFIQCMNSEDYARESVEKYLSSTDAWAKVDAVANGHVYYLPRGLFHNKPNSKYVDAYQMIFDYLYK